MRSSSGFASSVSSALYAVAVVAGATLLSPTLRICGAQTVLPAPTWTSARQLPPPRLVDDDHRSGPRFGVAAIIGGSVTAENAGRPITPITTLFGWQSEHQFQPAPGMPIPVTELIGLVGGVEQGVFLPSVSWLIGLRQPNGWEAAVGPTLTGAGLQLAFAAGMTRKFGTLNVPVNLAVAPGRRGAAISLTTGFNVRAY
ncbi:MAG: hypothetical protein JWM41_384 [Gemmatimonadetes bacterium]|nr:hypothetical protein [Gemmatimonadota bacterium]